MVGFFKIKIIPGLLWFPGIIFIYLLKDLFLIDFLHIIQCEKIIITCAVNHVPPYLLQQLEDGGRLILPLGSTAYYQTLTLVEKKGEELTVTHITSVVFVPMIGEAQKSGGG